MSSVQLLRNGGLRFDFGDYYPNAALEISLKRTIRVPDVPDSKTSSSLPPALGNFEYVAVETLRDKLPEDMVQKGGIVIPAWQAEAMWIQFTQNSTRYPFMVKIAAGGVNALSGKVWGDEPDMSGGHKKQDYLTVPHQPWLDGFKTGDGSVRQFVAAPLGNDVTVEEQLRGHAKHGGLQIIVHPLLRKHFEDVILPEREHAMFRSTLRSFGGDEHVTRGGSPFRSAGTMGFAKMGLAAGGSISQRIETDPYGQQNWDKDCATLFVHIVNAPQWTKLTGRPMPHKQPTALEYTLAGYKWFDYGDGTTTDIPTTKAFHKVQSLGQIAQDAGLPTDAPIAVPPQQVVDLTPKTPTATQWGKKPGLK